MGLLWGFLALGAISVVFVGGFAAMGGFTKATFGKYILSAVLATAGGGVGGDQIATQVLDLERPSALQDIVEDIELEDPCTWESNIHGKWYPVFLDDAASDFQINNNSYLRFKSRGKFTFRLATSWYDGNDVTFLGRYACGRQDRLKLVGVIDKNTLKEILGDVPNTTLSFTVEYDVDISDDSLELSLKDAYITGLGALLNGSDSIKNNRKEGFGCDLTDAKCWNASFYYIMNQNIRYITFEK